MPFTIASYIKENQKLIDRFEREITWLKNKNIISKKGEEEIERLKSYITALDNENVYWKQEQFNPEQIIHKELNEKLSHMIMQSYGKNLNLNKLETKNEQMKQHLELMLNELTSQRATYEKALTTESLLDKFLNFIGFNNLTVTGGLKNDLDKNFEKYSETVNKFRSIDSEIVKLKSEIKNITLPVSKSNEAIKSLDKTQKLEELKDKLIKLIPSEHENIQQRISKIQDELKAASPDIEKLQEFQQFLNKEKQESRKAPELYKVFDEMEKIINAHLLENKSFKSQEQRPIDAKPNNDSEKHSSLNYGA